MFGKKEAQPGIAVKRVNLAGVCENRSTPSPRVDGFSLPPFENLRAKAQTQRCCLVEWLKPCSSTPRGHIMERTICDRKSELFRDLWKDSPSKHV